MSFEKPVGSRGRVWGNESGVASVVALMLLLAVIVTFLALYATTYLPALKQQSEIDQVTSVKEAFMRFDNDMEHVLSEKKDASYGETIRLGGGDILINPEKSSGTLVVGPPDTLYTVTVSGSVTTTPFPGSLVNVTYFPSYSFWEDQGYSWQYGYINVTKKNRETPLSFATSHDVSERWIPGYAGKFLEISGMRNATNTSNFDIAITVVSVGQSSVTDEKSMASGNGAAVLRINSTVSTDNYDNSQGDLLVSMNVPDGIMAVPISSAWTDACNTLETRMDSVAGSSQAVLTYNGADTFTINNNTDHLVTLTVTHVRISVYVQ
ncbi:MAG: hypothetical protein WC342_00300 [Methanoregula sp.]|jgi:hypothetical protein